MSLKSTESAKYYDKKASYDSRFRSHLISRNSRAYCKTFRVLHQQNSDKWKRSEINYIILKGSRKTTRPRSSQISSEICSEIS